MSCFGAFFDTRSRFIEYTDYTEPLTFEEWRLKPDELKAGLLFVQFYNEITLAWDKADSRDFGDDAEGVTTILQYLQKQVSHVQYYRKDDITKKAGVEFRRNNPGGYITIVHHYIEENPSKFSSSYIYKIAYNCLYCICGHDRKRDKDKMENEISNIIDNDGTEGDLFDTVIDWSKSAESIVLQLEFEKQFWDIVEGEGDCAKKVMRYLISNQKSDLRSLKDTSELYGLDPLRDVSVSCKEVDKIVNELKDKFLDVPANSLCGHYISKFASINNIA